MNKKDLIPVILLALLIPVWMLVDRTFIAPKYPAKAPPAAAAHPAERVPVEGDLREAPPAAVPAPPAAAAAEPAPPPAEERTATIGNGKVELVLTSLGGGIKSATLLDYPEFDRKDSPPVQLDFSGAAALVYEGLEGIGPADTLHLEVAGDGRSAAISRTWGSGTSFHRTVALGDGYLLTVSDRFSNPGASPWHLPGLRIATGRMANPDTVDAMKGLSILGVDSYTPGGGVAYWGRKLHKLYGKEPAPEIDAVPPGMAGVEVDWVSAKNKFFAQILRPGDPIATMAILSTRKAGAKGVVPQDVAAALAFRPETVAPQAAYGLDYAYYIGPKQYSALKAAGYRMEKVMEFETTGTWSFMNWLMEPSRRFLLWTMNRFHAVIPNYGVAIILLTLLVRILFWPLTHKGTESMKRMQELQPEIKAIQEKYKKDPQRMQQETMKLYKERKVNPMGGCLPMFVQIPVFIALFTVLRNAIELRYAGFLWIADLSAAENLFAGKIPFVGSLNILPLVMSASMVWQQKLTPTAAATPEQRQQQKMMMFMMPVMMLFFFYSMPSGLVLYWTTSNLLMIAQTGLRNVRKKAAKA